MCAVHSIRTNSIRIACAAVAAACLLAAAAFGAETLTIKNAAISRTVSSVSGVLKTTKLEANGAQMLAGPSVEFMIDLLVKGRPVTLVPTDFTIKELDEVRGKPESRYSIELRCLREDLPLVVYLDYHVRPDAAYLQKSITVEPCKKAAGAVIRRVVIDRFQFTGRFRPLSAVDSDASGTPSYSFDRASSFAAIEPDANRGVYFHVSSLFGVETFTPDHSLVLAQEAFAPVEKGFVTGRATIGAVSGPPEALHRQFREFASSAGRVRDTSLGLPQAKYVLLSRLGSGPLPWGERQAADASLEVAAYLSRLDAFARRFDLYFAVRRRIRNLPEGKNLEGQAHIVDGRGFVILFNASPEPEKVPLPLEQLELTGELSLSDWTELESGTQLGSVTEVEVPAAGARIIGVNVEIKGPLEPAHSRSSE